MATAHERHIPFRSPDEGRRFAAWLAGTPFAELPETEISARRAWGRIYALFCAGERSRHPLPVAAACACLLRAIRRTPSADDRKVAELERLWHTASSTQAVDGLRPLAAAGHARALHLLGRSLALGAGCPKDLPESLGCHLRACEAGCAESAMDLAIDHDLGLGTARDPAMAALLFHELRAAAPSAAWAFLGESLCTGRFGPPDREAGELFLRRAAATGSPKAAILLVEGMADGRFPDTHDAGSLLERAAAGGDADALFALGRHELRRAQGGARTAAGESPDATPPPPPEELLATACDHLLAAARAGSAEAFAFLSATRKVVLASGRTATLPLPPRRQ